MDIAYLKTALVTLFVAVDPPGLAAIFLGLTAHMTHERRMDSGRRAVIIAFCILLAAALAGEPLLGSLGISLPAFRIAGGLLLFYIATEMVFEKREERKSQTAEEVVASDPAHEHDIAAFPLAIPLMAGPGAITATILQASNAPDHANLVAFIGLIALTIGSCYLVFMVAGRVDRFLGSTGRVILSRLLGVLLAAMAVQIVGDGVAAFIGHIKG